MREYKFKALFENQRTGIRTWFYVGVGDKVMPEWGARVTEWLQYTDLPDKNGKEIYEGDIVIPQTFTNAKYRVYWSQERLQWSIINTSNVSKESGRALINNSALYEVIGNIYENPELLTENV